MNGELAALVALCLHGNDWLATESGAAPALDAENSAFQYVQRVHASSPRRRLLGTSTWEADGVAAWLRFVKDSGARRLSLVVGASHASDLPDAVAAAFANGGRWALVEHGHTPRVWQSHWAVHDPNRPDRRIWLVELNGVPLKQHAPDAPAPSTARDDLRSALTSIRGFAEADAALASWAAWFAEALRLLDAPAPVIPYNPDLAPASLPLETRQLLAAAVQAWVFGGMGSWNDIGFTEPSRQAEYDRLTADLYRSILAALTSVTTAPRGAAWSRSE